MRLKGAVCLSVRIHRYIAVFLGMALAISLSSINPAYADALQLKYNFEKKIESSVASSSKPAPPAQRASYVQNLELGTSAFAISKNEEESIQFDFEKRRIRYLDHHTRSMRDVSLYPFLCKRDMMMQRQYLVRRQLEEMTQSFQTNISPFTLSCITGLPYPGNSNAEISVEEKDKTVVFSHKGRVVTTVTFSDTAVPESFANSYGKAILYELELHPTVRKQIADRKKVIEHLSYTVQLLKSGNSPAQTRTTTMQLLGTSRSADTVSAPNGYKLTFPTESPLCKFQEKLFFQTHPIELIESDKVIAEAQQLMAKQDYLDAFFCLMEFGMESNKDMGGALSVIQDQLSKEPVMLEMDKVLHAIGTPQQATDAFKELDLFKNQAPLKGYIMEVLKGNIALQYGLKADDLFLNGLNQNPLLAGVYVDLGTYYKMQERPDLAWDCFDLARQICPTHPTLIKVQRFEKILVDRHPEYF